MCDVKQNAVNLMPEHRYQTSEIWRPPLEAAFLLMCKIVTMYYHVVCKIKKKHLMILLQVYILPAMKTFLYCVNSVSCVRIE